jgi:hypothetical protein
MAKKISQLPLTTAVSGTDSFEIVQGGVSKRSEASGSWTLGSLIVSGTLRTDGLLTAQAGVITPVVGTGAASDLRFTTSGGTQFEIGHLASAVNRVRVTGATTGNLAFLSATGTDTNIGLRFATKGTGSQVFQTGGGSEVTQFEIVHTASAARWATITGSAGGNPVIDVSAGALKLSAGTSDIQWGKANVALGGGAAPTVGTIGGSGPAAVAQRNWLRFLESDGTASFIPVWR